mmetsp:Transcript_26094/g.39486  ORF Transcript_26094/g.39486 Transcript_26094/m.39486 type:complete len:484 (-) Transcript_26094:68-1519(-)|eukprot:CAMPEP_0178910692 /NCGR_PEP_ID=MMETSP0786-20121207/9237_1 /TAXON_ID=186022 /ORGANISM="Thalassionema frauenfeldii, Strain CCMP 1798" /LENGTH=483 /DNA_ID=CAMNT_0020582969 /DNA_START=60 /DNA_END=1511 /DNA_ORIENTATION=+
MGKKSKKKSSKAGDAAKSRFQAEDERENLEADQRTQNIIEKLIGGEVTASTAGTFDESEITHSSGDEDPLLGPLKAVLGLIRNAEEQGHPIDLYFDHEHHLGSCDGDAAYVLISLFTMKFGPPGYPLLSAITSSVIRCHDNLRTAAFIPTQAQYSGPLFEEFVKTQRANIGHGFSPVPYSVCQKLLADCLLRMKKSNKILQGIEERTIARLYGLKTTSKPPKFEESEVLPQPAPAPSVASLHLLLHQPEYYLWTMNEDLCAFFGDSSLGNTFATIETLKSAMSFISNDEYKRKRMYAMTKFMALWHSLRNEFDIASWLLWELKAMENYSDTATAIERLENNVLFQLMINKFFDMRVACFGPTFPQEGKYGSGMTNYWIYKACLESTGSLPPGMVLTASVARQQRMTDSNNANDNSTDEEIVDIIQMTRDLKFKKSKCAMCGATRSKTGGKLMQCTRCEAIVYCCREHQILHWKNGHKQECAKT